MKNVSIITVIACSILFSICAVNAAEHSREEYGSKMVKLEWCTEEFHTQLEFHTNISQCDIFGPDNDDLHRYELINGGSAWSPSFKYSPESTLNIFVRTKKQSNEKISEVKARISVVVENVTGMPPADDDSRWWIDGDEVSYLLINM